MNIKELLMTRNTIRVSIFCFNPFTPAMCGELILCCKIQITSISIYRKMVAKQQKYTFGSPLLLEKSEIN